MCVRMSVLQVFAVGGMSGNMAEAVKGEVEEKKGVGRGCLSVFVSMCWCVGDTQEQD